MRKVHPEFAYQARELEGQIEGILGDPPDHKNYKKMVDALRTEYLGGGGIDDLNMMAFALVDVIEFHDPKAAFADAEDFEYGDAPRVFGAASCPKAPGLLEALEENHPELARQAIITALLHKHPRMWDDEDTSLDRLADGDDGDDDEDDYSDDAATDDFTQIFDQQED